MTSDQIRTLGMILAMTVCLHIGWRMGAKLLGWD